MADYDRMRLEEMAAISELAHGLSDAQWDHASLCDGWRVRDVVESHVPGLHHRHAGDARQDRPPGLQRRQGVAPGVDRLRLGALSRRDPGRLRRRPPRQHPQGHRQGHQAPGGSGRPHRPPPGHPPAARPGAPDARGSSHRRARRRAGPGRLREGESPHRRAPPGGRGSAVVARRRPRGARDRAKPSCWPRRAGSAPWASSTATASTPCAGGWPPEPRPGGGRPSPVARFSQKTAPALRSEAVPDLVLLRHGESTWNAQNLFTGWTDVDLTAKGEAEARQAGRPARRRGGRPGLELEVVHTSVLTRAVRTANLALDELGRSWLPVRRHWRLNERHYGALAGSRQEADHGRVRRGAGQAVAPQLRHPARRPGAGRRRATPSTTPATGTCPAGALPDTECLADVVLRMVPYWEDAIAADLRAFSRRARGGPRQLDPGAGQVPEGHPRRRHRRVWRSPPGCRGGSASTTTSASSTTANSATPRPSGPPPRPCARQAG